MPCSDRALTIMCDLRNANRFAARHACPRTSPVRITVTGIMHILYKQYKEWISGMRQLFTPIQNPATSSLPVQCPQKMQKRRSLYQIRVSQYPFWTNHVLQVCLLHFFSSTSLEPADAAAKDSDMASQCARMRRAVSALDYSWHTYTMTCMGDYIQISSAHRRGGIGNEGHSGSQLG